MLVSIITAGSRGDVQPYVALGLGLRRLGHDVRIATHEGFRDFVEGHGLGFAPITGDPRAILRTGAADAWLASGRGRHMLRFFREVREHLRAEMPAALDSYWGAAQGADAVLFNAVTVPAWHAAERLGVPSFAAYLQPLTPTREFAAVGVPAALRLPPALNRLSHVAAERFLWRQLRDPVERWRTASLGMPPAMGAGPFGPLGAGATRTLYGFSQRVVARPADWGPGVHVTGYWTLPLPAGWTPAPALARFLADGDPPVYVGFGSMTPAGAGAMTALVLEALERAGRRAVLVRGWGALGEAASLPAWAHAADDVPHEWLFPRCAAVVHHGGAGTTGAGLRSGVPSVVVPLGFDQHFWGARVAALGAGPAPVPRRRLTARALAAAVVRATTDPAIAAGARRLGEALRTEDGVAVAAGLVGEALG